MVLISSVGYASLDAVGTESGTDGSYRLVVVHFPCDAPTLTVGLDPWEAQTVDVKCVESDQTVDFALGR